MTAPETNTDTQASRHRPAIIGILIAVLLGGLFFFLNMIDVADEAEVEELPASVPQDAPATTGTDGAGSASE
ncbi:hypothetical protein [Pseudooceanicola sp.]|uniref:hypothetical protein n=1 Tax=Pseudooceanicola sp. TaxID=1914328 RepID=UPI0035C6E721